MQMIAPHARATTSAPGHDGIMSNQTSPRSQSSHPGSLLMSASFSLVFKKRRPIYFTLGLSKIYGDAVKEVCRGTL